MLLLYFPCLKDKSEHLGMNFLGQDDDLDDDTTIVQSGYHNNGGRYFHPSQSSSFQLVKLGNVNVTFLDHTNLLGYDGQDFAKVFCQFLERHEIGTPY